MKHLRREFDSLAEGAILVLTVGDALGVPVEFTPRNELEQNPVTVCWHGRKFCVSVLRQNQEWHEINVHTWGRYPLTNPVPGGWMVCAPLAA